MAAAKTPISLLQETLIKHGIVPVYTESSVSNNGHFVCEVMVQGKKYLGKATTKKQAKQNAAKLALECLRLDDSPNSYTDLTNYQYSNLDILKSVIENMEKLTTECIAAKNFITEHRIPKPLIVHLATNVKILQSALINLLCAEAKKPQKVDK